MSSVWRPEAGGGGSCVQARGGQIRGGEGRGQKTRETREEKEEEGGKKERVGGEDIVHILYVYKCP